MNPSQSTFLRNVKLTAPPTTDDKTAMLHGGCLCEKVRFTYEGLLAGDLGAATLCHCGQCRKAQGYASAAAPAWADGYVVTHGRELICEYPSSPDKVRAFCRLCGSPLYSRRLSQPLVLRLRLGSLDEAPLSLKIGDHIFCEDEPSWSPDENARRHPALEAQRG